MKTISTFWYEADGTPHRLYDFPSIKETLSCLSFKSQVDKALVMLSNGEVRRYQKRNGKLEHVATYPNVGSFWRAAYAAGFEGGVQQSWEDFDNLKAEWRAEWEKEKREDQK